MQVSIKELERCRSVMPAKIFMQITQAMLQGERYIEIPYTTFEKLQAKQQRYDEKMEKLRLCAEYNNNGMECETRGDIAGAIHWYEENIKLRYPATHAYTRLMVLYRKAKEYKKELRVIKAACSVFRKQGNAKYIERMNKVLELIKKQATSKN